MNDLKIAQDNNSSSSRPRITVDMTKDQLKAAQAYDLNGQSRSTGSGTTTPPTGSSSSPRPGRA